MSPSTSGEPSDDIVHLDSSGEPSLKRTRRPFLDANEPLERVLVGQYLAPALAWLLGPDSAGTPAMRVGSSWEVALTLAATLEVRRRWGGQPWVARRFPRLASQIDEMARWLLSKAERHPEGSFCWDHSAWDTAVIARTLFGVTATGSYKELAVALDAQARTVDGAVWWLIRRYVDYSHDTVRSALNPAELAQIGRTVVDLAKQDASRVAACAIQAGWTGGPDALLQSIADVLLRRQSDCPLSPSLGGHHTSQTGTWWDDWFGSCDVLAFLIRLLDLNGERTVTLEPSMIVRIRESIARCFTLIEDTQSEGLWGAYLDTIAVLGTYVHVGSAMAAMAAQQGTTHLTAQPRIVFRTIRWACDPTQSFADGSILHTGFLTTFFVNTLLAVIQFWPKTQLPLIDVYDELSQVMDRGVTIDRANFLTASIERDAAIAKLANQQRRVDQLIRFIGHERWFHARLVLTVVLVPLTLVLSFAIPVVAGLVDFGYRITNADTLISVLAVLVVAFFGIVTVLWTVDRAPDVEGTGTDASQ